jgi:hypothetical protein
MGTTRAHGVLGGPRPGCRGLDAVGLWDHGRPDSTPSANAALTPNFPLDFPAVPLYYATRHSNVGGDVRPLTDLCPPAIVPVSAAFFPCSACLVPHIDYASPALVRALSCEGGTENAPARKCMARYLYPFPLCEGFVLPGTIHGLRTCYPSYTLWEQVGEEWRSVSGAQLRVHSRTYDVTVTFVQPMAGVLALDDGGAL